MEGVYVIIRKLITLLIAVCIIGQVLFIDTGRAEAAAYKYVVDPYHAYSYEEMLEDASELQKMYPNLIRLDSIGKSVEGRDLLLIKFGNGDRSIFLDGSIHACEYISTTYLMYMLDRYAYAYTTGGRFEGFDLKKILESVTFHIVPMVNPDGVNLVQNGLETVKNYEAVSKIYTGYADWKANINGVDLNRNFDNNWYVDRPANAPAPAGFKGYKPLSEPESKAIEQYLSSRMFWTYINFHSKGEGIYGWDDKNSGYYPQLNSMVSRITKAGNYSKFTDTPATDYGTLLGYMKDTFLKPALTIELCKYVWSKPYPDEDFDSVWTPAKTFCLIVAEEVMNMAAQEYLVYQNNTFLHAFCDEAYAKKYAAKWANSRVVHVKGGIESLINLTPSDMEIFIDGGQAELQAYNINGNNYIKLRDLAACLNGTQAQFEVEYLDPSKSIVITDGAAYTSVGGELSGYTGEAVMAVPSQSKVYMDGKQLEVAAYIISGSSYYKLRDIASALNFGITYESASRQIHINTSDGYKG